MTAVDKWLEIMIQTISSCWLVTGILARYTWYHIPVCRLSALEITLMTMTDIANDDQWIKAK